MAATKTNISEKDALVSVLMDTATLPCCASVRLDWSEGRLVAAIGISTIDMAARVSLLLDGLLCLAVLSAGEFRLE